MEPGVWANVRATSTGMPATSRVTALLVWCEGRMLVFRHLGRARVLVRFRTA
jgi:hypothetical protein